MRYVNCGNFFYSETCRSIRRSINSYNLQLTYLIIQVMKFSISNCGLKITNIV